ncbi:hypothetical protein CA54_54840 [Symmachiella macrocystis]|uniref:Chromosome partition protein Smc n=1 Tax=Symmachiella macrocystis TaxID=2527985 RepID=A0A5C6B6X0_9PLAN|nr:hypothetical protein [Symmachiella macrocystis]TWU07079.1 hypothetical protein CA54_54840 [Symmachiella macrocystis]
MRFRHFVLIVAAIVAFQGAFLAQDGQLDRLYAQEAAPEPANDETTPNNAGGSLDSTQQAISRRYKRFEETLLKMAELMRKTDPERAELLRRVIGKSKEQFIAIRMDKLVELLEKESFGNAIEQQDDLVLELTALLDLLGSEDRAKEIEEEKKRLQDLIRNVDALLGKQKGLRADTERGAGEKGLQKRQHDLEERTQKLGEKIDRQDQKKAQDLQGDQEPGGEKSDSQKSDAEKSDGQKTDGKKSDGQKSDGQKSDGQKSDGQKSDGQKSDGQKSDGQKSDGQKSDGQKSDGQKSDGQKSDGQKSDGQKSDGQKSDGQQKQQPSTPGRQEVEQARKAMQDALDKLKEGQRDDASQDQTDAIAKLQQAKERLEEILRQLREEERERMLTKLEDRFQQMLAVQILIYDNTVPLGKIPEDQRETRHISKAKELARKEAGLALEAEKALTLLKDEGSSVAFPEAVEQMRDDMRTVMTRLEAAQVGELTQGIEQDIIETLEELVEALQREIEQGKAKPQDQQKKQQQKRKEELLNKLAELKMLRSLQLRINRGTKRLGRLFDGEQAEQQDILDQLRILGERQRRVQNATNDIATGKNQ